MRRAILIALVAALAAMPLLNALPADKPLHVSDFLISITGEWLCYAILALSIDLAWGYQHPLTRTRCLFLRLAAMPSVCI